MKKKILREYLDLQRTEMAHGELKQIWIKWPNEKQEYN